MYKALFCFNLPLGTPKAREFNEWLARYLEEELSVTYHADSVKRLLPLLKTPLTSARHRVKSIGLQRRGRLDTNKRNLILAEYTTLGALAGSSEGLAIMKLVLKPLVRSSDLPSDISLSCLPFPGASQTHASRTRHRTVQTRAAVSGCQCICTCRQCSRAEAAIQSHGSSTCLCATSCTISHWGSSAEPTWAGGWPMRCLCRSCRC